MLLDLDVRHDGVGELLRAGRFVDGRRHFAEEDLDLGQDALGNRLAGHGERRGMRRMAVDDGLDVGPMSCRPPGAAGFRCVRLRVPASCLPS